MVVYDIYEVGVYRQNDIKVVFNEAEVLPAVIEYFKGTDDYHVVCVDAITEEGKTEYQVFRCESEYVRVKRGYIRHEIHGLRTILNNRGDVVFKFQQYYTLEEGEEFVNEI